LINITETIRTSLHADEYNWITWIEVILNFWVTFMSPL